jgi:iron only hydrogenase large subunit-like protein
MRKDENYINSIRTIKEKCRGCTHCLRVCPTEAIRVRNRKMEIYDLKCIDCGECYKVCPTNSIFSFHDNIDIIQNFDYKILIVPNTLPSINFGMLTYEDVIKRIFSFGFNEIWEEGIGNEAYLIALKNKLIEKKERKKPIISTSCPSVVRYLQVNYPLLINNLTDINLPLDIIGNYIREKKKDAKNFGLFYLSTYPCKVTAIKNPLGLKSSPYDGVFSFSEIYRKILIEKKEGTGDFFKSGKVGVSSGRRGGEEEFLDGLKVISIDGIWNIKKFFDEMEEEKIPYFDYIDAKACSFGCVGGVFLSNQNFLLNFYNQKEEEKRRKNFISEIVEKDIDKFLKEENLLLNDKINPRPQYLLSENMDIAAKIFQEINMIYELLPKLDCGSCGAPSCRSFAEDVVLNKAKLSDCKFIEDKNLY